MNQRILIIDDDEELCEELKEIFQHEGYDVDAAHSGMMGRALLGESSYKVVILDLKLPGMRGTEVLRLIKDNEPEQKVVILSAKPLSHPSSSPEVDEDDLIFHAADAVISKPVKVEDLLRKIRELTDMK